MILKIKTFLAKCILQYPVMAKEFFFPAKWDFSTFKDSVVSESSLITDHAARPAPEKIYIFWTGENEMSANRKRAVISIKEKSGVAVELITPGNLHGYILPEAPLPDVYYNLSLNHRSDFLRCYFMHHFGGGYCDIKRVTKSWKPAFCKLNASDAYALGYPEKNPGGIALSGNSFDKILSTFFFKCIGNGAFICKPGTPLTAEWYKAVLNALCRYNDALKKNPGNTYGSNDGYPVPWAALQGKIVHALSFKYASKILKTSSIRPSMKNYR